MGADVNVIIALARFTFQLQQYRIVLFGQHVATVQVGPTRIYGRPGQTWRQNEATSPVPARYQKALLCMCAHIQQHLLTQCVHTTTHDDPAQMFDAATVADGAHAAAWHGWGLLEKREGNYLRARDLWLTGVQKTRTKPNPYLYQSLAVLAADLQRPDEARKWFQAGTGTPMVRRAIFTLIITLSHWPHIWCLVDRELHRELPHRAGQVMPCGRRGHCSRQNRAMQQSFGSCSARDLKCHLGAYKQQDAHATCLCIIKLSLVCSVFVDMVLLHDTLAPRNVPSTHLPHSSRYIYLSWALWEQRLGNVSNARRLLERGHDLNRTDPAILQAWAMLEGLEGNIPRARELFEKAVAVDAAHLYVWQAWGVLEFRSGNLSKARELFQRGVWADPNSPSVALVFQAWAVLERSAGDINAARALFKCAVKADPKSSPSWMVCCLGAAVGWW